MRRSGMMAAGFPSEATTPSSPPFPLHSLESPITVHRRSVSSAWLSLRRFLWELLLNYASKRPITVGDGNAAMTGLLLAMVLPASAPWWLVLLGTFLAIVIGMQIFGGIGANPFNPVALSMAILMVSYKTHLDFDAGLVNFSLDFPSMADPMAALKAFGPAAVENVSTMDLLMGLHVGGLGSGCGLAIALGGAYLILRGMIRWEISASFLAGIFVTALLFNMADPVRYALTGVSPSGRLHPVRGVFPGHRIFILPG
jgi:electron transport complex protein RnfD